MTGFGIELEWAALFLLCATGTSLFDRFEIGTSWWRKWLRWMFAAVLTIGSFRHIGHWSLTLLASFAITGVVVHFRWCRRNGIHPTTAEPWAKYRALRGWRNLAESGDK